MGEEVKAGIRDNLDRCLPKKGIQIIADWLYKAHLDNACKADNQLNSKSKKIDQAS